MAQNRKIQVHTLSSNFREATRIVTTDKPKPKGDEVLVRTHWVGINASDINFTSGRYLPGVSPPFDAGMECLGVIEAAGRQVTAFSVGDVVAMSGYGFFCEYKAIKAKGLIKLPFLRPEALPLLVSGLTASLALEQMAGLDLGKVGKGEKWMAGKRQMVVLVTAAAGGTGTFAVQLAKKAGAIVAGTCSTEAKAQYLRSIGCDRPINYKTENVFQVLKKEFPHGVDVVYESVGGKMFEDCLNNMAPRGKLIVIGMISGYQSQAPWTKGGSGGGGTAIAMKLLRKSISLSGFFLLDYAHLFGKHLRALTALIEDGTIVSAVDQGDGDGFKGLEDVPRAIDYMYTGRNRGKVVVRIVDEQGNALTNSDTYDMPSKL